MDSASTSIAIDAVVSFLKRAELHLASVVAASPPRSSTINGASTSHLPKDPASPANGTSSLNSKTPISTCINYKPNFLEKTLLKDLKDALSKVQFVPLSNRTNAPEIALFGDFPYVFNSATKVMNPEPILANSTLDTVLNTVNSEMGQMYNSVLITKYRNKNVSLGWHKDNEKEIDHQVPIFSLVNWGI